MWPTLWFLQKILYFLNLVRGEREHNNYGITHTLPYPLVLDEGKKRIITIIINLNADRVIAQN